MNMIEFEAAETKIKHARQLKEQIQEYCERREALNGPVDPGHVNNFSINFAPHLEGSIYVNGQMAEPIRSNLQAMLREHVVAAGAAFIHDALVVLEAEFAAIEISTPSMWPDKAMACQ